MQQPRLLTELGRACLLPDLCGSVPSAAFTPLPPSHPLPFLQGMRCGASALVIHLPDQAACALPPVTVSSLVPPGAAWCWCCCCPPFRHLNPQETRPPHSRRKPSSALSPHRARQSVCPPTVAKEDAPGARDRRVLESHPGTTQCGGPIAESHRSPPTECTVRKIW